VGKYTASVSCTLSEALEADYEIAECRDCAFAILPREITVTPILPDAEYDGAEHGFTGSYEIVSGEVLDADKAAFESALYVYFTGTTLGGETVENALSVTEAGTYTLVLMPDALTDYTVIDSGEGSFTLTPIELHVRTLNYSKTYDGTPLYGMSESYEIAQVLISGELVSTHRFTALQSEAAHITDVLDSGMPNDTPYRIFDSENLDKTHNYNIVYEQYGYLFISAASVTLRPSMDRDSVEYDGTAHAYDGGYEVVSGEVYSDIYLTAYFTGTTAGGFVISIYDYADSVADAGAYTLTIDENLARANNPNYTISCESGAFTVLKRAVTVTTGSGSKEYDGTPLAAGDASVSAPTSDRPLVNDHVIEIDADSIAYSFVSVADTAGKS
ncbi:MAG: hypothetical protein K2M95_01885, partial [Clostridiales bacterium]|nr:hypothetical protein [Clostridiales bacterium]